MAGLVGGALHTMAVQSDLLKDLDLGKGLFLEAVLELCCTADLVSPSRWPMLPSVQLLQWLCREWHLWLNLSGISPIGIAVNMVVQKFPSKGSVDAIQEIHSPLQSWSFGPQQPC